MKKNKTIRMSEFKTTYWNLDYTKEQLRKLSVDELIAIIDELDEGYFEAKQGEDL